MLILATQEDDAGGSQIYGQLEGQNKKMKAGGKGEREGEEKIGEEERKEFRQRENQSLKRVE